MSEGGRYRRGLKQASGWLLAAILAAGALSAVGPSAAAVPAGSVVKTADLSKFQPGNIISDATFFNKGTMTEAQIQTFLQSKVPTCRSGYTCLKDWYDTSRATSADAMCGAYPGGMRERASAIIFKVAQACGINPQVLIVMLQKEQGLILHTWPSEWRYTIAMGQGCPDTAACDTRYYGFFNQVYGAAWQMKRYANPPGTSAYFTWYAPGKTWNVRWHPNAACGSAPVYIQNQATANLYYYTPYQPNAAAIRAGYGEGDGCSSYGNRNFYQYFTDWFGATPATAGVSFDSLEKSPHVAALAADGSVWAYPFSATGIWGARKQVASNALGIETLLSPGDFDGDGKRDLIGVSADGAAYLWRGDGSATYKSPSGSVADWSGAALITDAGDFSGDTVPDVFTTTSAGALMLWRGTGTGGFRQPVQVGEGWSGMNLISGGADLSGDGAADLVARDAGGKLWLFRGNGTGGFAGKAQIGSGWSNMTSVFVPGNFAGSSLPDLLAVDASGGLRLFTGVGGGSIRTGGVVGVGWGAFGEVLGNAPASNVVRTLQGGAGDVSGDGPRDVLALTPSGELRAYHGDGKGGWAGASTIAEGWTPEDRIVTLGDFDGDGEPDIGRVTSAGLFLMIPSSGAGTRDSAVQIGSGWSIFTHIVGGVDFDGDENVDVLAVNELGDMILYRGSGSGGWMPEARPAVGKGWQTTDLILAPGDWNGDGNPDLLTRRIADGSLWQYALSGSGNFLGANQVGSGWGGMALAAPGQFDGNTGPDVIAVDAAGKLYLYRGDGKAGWSGGRTQIGTGWSGMVRVA